MCDSQLSWKAPVDLMYSVIYGSSNELVPSLGGLFIVTLRGKKRETSNFLFVVANSN